jgi:hypothetical protein
MGFLGWHEEQYKNNTYQKEMRHNGQHNHLPLVGLAPGRIEQDKAHRGVVNTKIILFSHSLLPQTDHVHWKSGLTVHVAILLLFGKVIIQTYGVVCRQWDHSRYHPSCGLRTGSEGSKTANLYKAIEPAQPETRIADRGIIQGVRSTYFIVLYNFMLGLIRTLSVDLKNTVKIWTQK